MAKRPLNSEPSRSLIPVPILPVVPIFEAIIFELFVDVVVVVVVVMLDDVSVVDVWIAINEKLEVLVGKKLVECRC